MEKFKKKLFGYQPEKVDASIQELDDLVNSLKREIMDLKDNSKQPSADLAKYKTEQIEMLNTIDTLKRSLSEKDSQIEQLKSNVRTYASMSSNSNSKVTNGLRDEIYLLNTELANIKQSVASKDEYIAKLQATVHKLTTQSKQGPQYTKMVEAVYLRAFESAKHITVDAKNEAVDLTNKVYNELNSSIIGAATAQYDLINIKNELLGFISKGVESFKTLEQLTDSFPSVDVNTPEYIRNLKGSKEKIVSEIEKSLSDFEVDIVRDTENTDIDGNMMDITESIMPPVAVNHNSSYFEKPVEEKFLESVLDNEIENQFDPAFGHDMAYNNRPDNEQNHFENDNHVYMSEDEATYEPKFLAEDLQEEINEYEQSTITENREEEIKAFEQENATAENDEEQIDASTEENITAENDEKKVDSSDEDEKFVPKPRINIQDLLKKYSNIS